MQSKNILYILAAATLVFLTIFIWNNYQIQVQERLQKPIRLPPQLSGACGFESCHGLDLTCGPNVPEACDLMYSIGDNCRQFASCEKTNGSCGLVAGQEFTDCKACVEQCIADFPDDPVGQSSCESSCTESLMPSE